MSNKIIAFLLVFACFLATGVPLVAAPQSEIPRSEQRMTENWRFHLGDVPGAKSPAFDDSDWRRLSLPHDWSIEQSFDKDSPSGSGGGYLPGGIGWYRKTLKLSEADSSKRVYIDFDGIYRNSKVWINGEYLGNRPSGYISFRYDLTPHLRYGDRENIIAVRVDNSDQPNSRWYSGSGIYRNVWLVKTHRIHVDHWGTKITTPVVNRREAYVSVQTTLNNTTSHDQQITVHTAVKDADGRAIASNRSGQLLSADSKTMYEHQVKVKDPILWSVQDPYMYTVITTVKKGDVTIDRYETPLGIRYFRFDSDSGFHLNGERVQIRGVCEHHDLGSLGAALNKRALERRLEILRSMGVNAIRTAHNPPSPELLELTDEMGFIVMDEIFDEWKQKKVEHGYSKFFNNWYERDLSDFIKRDRNHPSIITWSIGNEILEQWDSTGVAIARDLAEKVRRLDDTRPITAGLNGPQPDNFVIRSGALDLIGYNYHNELFPKFPVNFPGQKFIATETTSALGSRGFYQMPSDSIMRWPKAWDIPFEGGNDEQMVSSYDNVSTPWGSTHEEALRSMNAADYLSGMFIWTGFDYIGEPTPYTWPSRSSYFGILDLAGFPKDAFYLYKSEWTDTPTLHLFPHWNNWNEGDTVDVLAYTNATRVELFLNGESLGTRKKTDGKLHLKWKVPYASGELKAVGRLPDGVQITDVVRTAGEASDIALSAERMDIIANGRDLAFIQVAVHDDAGVLVPDANQRIDFDVTGPAKIVGVSNGDQTSHESFKAGHRKAFHGRCQLTVQSTGGTGTIRVKANGDGLSRAVIKIEAVSN